MAGKKEDELSGVNPAVELIVCVCVMRSIQFPPSSLFASLQCS